MSPFPPLLPVAEIQRRLASIFPEGTPRRGFCVREIAARTVFVMLYVGAIEGSGRYVRPDQVTRMTNRQARKIGDQDRRLWAEKSLGKSEGAIAGRWYAANTREPIRDETLREGLMRLGGVVARQDLPTTSAHPRYALSVDFSRLFDPELTGSRLSEATEEWRGKHLSVSARARIELLRRAVVASTAGVQVRFPNGETRRLAAGPSSAIAQAVVEEFAPRFLKQPAMLFLSESAAKVVARDEELARSIGLSFPPERLLPDIVLVDLGPAEPIVVFVEIVASEGPVTEMRQEALIALATAAGFARPQLAFVSAYLHRDHPAVRRTLAELAWNSFAWFASEPDALVAMIGERHGRSLGDLL